MKYAINRRLRFVNRPDAQPLYNWALQEFDENIDITSQDLIPWPWMTWFACEALSFQIKIQAEREFGKTRDIRTAEHSEISYQENIRGVFTPIETRFSLFGCDRILDHFDVWISAVKNADEEGCITGGSLAYHYEDESGPLSQSDFVEIFIYINKKYFEELKKLVLEDLPLSISLGIGSVSGFYSSWSPSIKTSNIKILTSTKNPEVEGCHNAELDIPILGNVSAFTLNFSTKKNAV